MTLFLCVILHHFRKAVSVIVCVILIALKQEFPLSSILKVTTNDAGFSVFLQNREALTYL